jgi:hypothetical protein
LEDTQYRFKQKKLLTHFNKIGGNKPSTLALQYKSEGCKPLKTAVMKTDELMHGKRKKKQQQREKFEKIYTN